MNLKNFQAFFSPRHAREYILPIFFSFFFGILTSLIAVSFYPESRLSLFIFLVFITSPIYLFAFINSRFFSKHPIHTDPEEITIINATLEEKIAGKRHRESEEELRFVTQNAIDGIISVTEEGEIISWNYGAEKIFGYDQNTILGKPLNLIIPSADLFRNEAAVKPIELQGKHQNESILPIEVSHTRWKKHGEVFDTIIIRETSEKKENEKRLIKAMREARAANAAKSEFLAIISHELRTPLNVIIGFNQCLLMGMDGNLTEQQVESLKKIEKSSFNLSTLINDILDLAKMEARKMEFELMPQNIVELVNSCIEDMQNLAKKKRLKMEMRSMRPYILIEMDKTRIRQVILNLLSNAIKFTEKGSIKIEVYNFPENIKIDVKDTGIGLSADELSKIFQPFSQGDSSITRKYGGTGLGLVISKKIIELHGGQINVISKKGEGSTFSFTLPKNQ